MKKTLLLTHEYFPFAGGIATYCYGIFRNFNDQDYLVATDQKMIQSGLNTIRVKLLTKFLRPRWLIGLWAVNKIVNKYAIQQIFTPHIFPLGQIAYQLYEWYKIPYIISLHGLDINLALAKNPVLTKAILNHASQIVVNSQTTKNLLPLNEIKTPITIITPYFDQRQADASKVQAIQNQYGNQDIILTVGRLVKRKNQESVIRALAAMPEQKITYLIIGDGPDRNRLQQLTEELKVADRVKFLTAISHDDLPNYYQAAKLFVMPTLQLNGDIEGYGIVYLESAYYGLPAIVSRGSSAEEIFISENSAIFVDPNNLQQLTDAIQSALANAEKRQTIADNSWAITQKLEDWSAKAKILEKLLV